MARAHQIPGFDCEEPFLRAAARAIEVRASEVFEHAEGVLELQDIERLHDMRVSTRRLRAALEAFEPCFPRKRWRKALRKVKELGDALGERRDRDVHIELLGEAAGAIEPADRPALEALLERLRNEQRCANEELRRFVARGHLEKLRGRLDGLVEGQR